MQCLHYEMHIFLDKGWIFLNREGGKIFIKGGEGQDCIVADEVYDYVSKVKPPGYPSNEIVKNGIKNKFQHGRWVPLPQPQLT